MDSWNSNLTLVPSQIIILDPLPMVLSFMIFIIFFSRSKLPGSTSSTITIVTRTLYRQKTTERSYSVGVDTLAVTTNGWTNATRRKYSKNVFVYCLRWRKRWKRTTRFGSVSGLIETKFEWRSNALMTLW